MSLLVDIEKNLGSFRLKVRLEAGDETLALLGASGCGKSLTLRCIAGIERPNRGRIIVDGVTFFDSEKRINLSPQARRTGLMFQNYALFPNMTVLQNISAGARQETDAAQRKKAVALVLESFGLAELAGRFPSQLSGGQQQRVALARMLVSRPRILLLDEPFAALDSHLRLQLEQEVREVIRGFGGTAILVSHDSGEVFRMSDSIAIMNGGRVETSGAKGDIFAVPGTITAAVMTGCRNVSGAEVLPDGRIRALDWGIELNLRTLGDRIAAVGIRAREVRYGSGENAFDCRVVDEIENPFSYTVLLRPDGTENSLPIEWELDKEAWQRIRAKRVKVHLPPAAILPLK